MSEKGLGELLPRASVKGFATRTAAKYASGTMWPHGEWSFGYGRERCDGGEWHEDPYVGMGVVDTEAARSEARRALSALDLSDIPNSHKRAKRGLKGITGYGAQMVKAAGFLLQERYPQHRVTLGTITLPPMSQETRREVVAAWPEIVRQLLQWQSRRLSRRGLPPAVVSVTEIQPARLAESGEACLHLHQLWLNVPAKSGHWSFSPNVIRSYMSRLLMRTCPSYRWGFINVDTRPVEGQAAAYLAKYMSKGKQTIVEALEDWGEDNHPSTWWNMTKPTRDMVKAATMRGRKIGSRLESLLHYALDNDRGDVYAFLKPVVRNLGKWEVIIGWRGRFETEFLTRVKSMLGSGHMPRAAMSA